jgi:hypothetical protein
MPKDQIAEADAALAEQKEASEVEASQGGDAPQAEQSTEA